MHVCTQIKSRECFIATIKVRNVYLNILDLFAIYQITVDVPVGQVKIMIEFKAMSCKKSISELRIQCTHLRFICINEWMPQLSINNCQSQYIGKVTGLVTLSCFHKILSNEKVSKPTGLVITSVRNFAL